MCFAVFAARTEHANYEESSEVVPEITAADRAAKVEELKAKIASRRAEREVAEKVIVSQQASV